MNIQINLTDKLHNLSDQVEILELRENGVIHSKYNLTLTQVIQILSSSLGMDEGIVETPVLPKNCVKHLKTQSGRLQLVAIEVPKANFNVKFANTDFYLGHPRSLFVYKISENRVQDVFVYALKNGEKLIDETDLYHFPYTNIYESGRVCMGGNSFPDFDHIAKLDSFHNFFMAAEYTPHMQPRVLERHDMRALTTLFDNKAFNDDLLLRKGKKLSDLITVFTLNDEY